MNVERKFIECKNVNDYEIFTDSGWVDIKKSLKTIKYQIYKIETTNFFLEC